MFWQIEQHGRTKGVGRFLHGAFVIFKHIKTSTRKSQNTNKTLQAQHSCSFFMPKTIQLLQIESWSSPVQRDLGILLRLHRFLIFTFGYCCHTFLYIPVDCLLVENTL